MRIFKKLFPFLVLIFILNIFFDLCFNSASYMRIALHDLQSSDEDFKVVFVGQSHGSNAFNPYIIEEKTGMPSYNLCKGLICVRDLYYLVRESNYKNNVDYIIYDIDSSYWLGFEDPNYFADGYIYPHINNPLNKLDYFFNYSIKENFRYSLFRFVVYGTGDIRAVPENLKKRLSVDYLKYDINSVLTERDKKEYVGRGFFSGAVKGKGDFSPTCWEDSKVKEKTLQGFKNMVDYCMKNDITFICVSSPLPEERIEAENYEAFHEYFTNLTGKEQVEFWDFNYIKDDILTWDSSDFMDLDGHMLGTLANKYSSVLGEMLNQYELEGNVCEWFEK